MQHKRKVEKKKDKCLLVKLWEEGWRLKQRWHKREERAIRRGVLVERYEEG